MCKYMLVTYRCAHTAFLAGPNCATVLKQLCRIHQPEAWTRRGRKIVPFDWPDSCLPGDDNIVPVSSDRCCGWECTNTFARTQHEGDELVASPGARGASPANSVAVASPVSSRGNKYRSPRPEHQAPSYHAKDDCHAGHYDGSSPFSGSQALCDYVAINAAAFAQNKNNVEALESISTQATLDREEAVTKRARSVKERETRMAEEARTLGMPNAQYGVPRIGVGWREGEDEMKIVGNWCTVFN
ncbi:uncharacterized protein F4812DRAFT_137621 [Daldinia caldariorum]|uniref:uncharacterized protein n=1 Tax=Daldinia caldariorum TaxID=326644 RepID=UPI0020075055|nr:uncharacterized protein F4812DRAFT_137621 [Daldinia caldariorum]KAI1465240.1 hypothetical protein F4812DRAFT_137621 [Daldinia caldariorum]